MPSQIYINIDVDDLDRAIRFYCDGVGMTMRRRLFGGRVAELSAAGCSLHLLTKPAGTASAPGEAQSRDYRRHWTPVHLDFVVPDIDKAVETAVTAGATLERAPTSYEWGRIAMLADPFGHGICLIQLLGRGYDEVEG